MTTKFGRVVIATKRSRILITEQQGLCGAMKLNICIHCCCFFFNTPPLLPTEGEKISDVSYLYKGIIPQYFEIVGIWKFFCARIMSSAHVILNSFSLITCTFWITLHTKLIPTYLSSIYINSSRLFLLYVCMYVQRLSIIPSNQFLSLTSCWGE